MDLSIIIINYKSAGHVLACIESIYNETKEHSFEIIVVDNNSEDDSERKIRSAFPNIIWLQTGYNSGFARANNAGIKISHGQYILLLNADTIILNKAIDKTIDLFKNNTEAVGCGVQLLNPDLSLQISGAYFIIGGLNGLLPLPYLGRLIRFMGYKLNTKIPSVKEVSDVQEVDWIVGAFFMVKKEVLERSGLLDEDFFMYAEEIEWCSRLRRQGKLVLFSGCNVIHLLGGSSNEYYNTTENENGINIWSIKGRQVLLSHVLRVRKQFGILWYLFTNVVYVFEIPVFFFCLLIDKIITAGKAKYLWKDFAGYVKNIISILFYLPKIFLNKPYFYKVL